MKTFGALVLARSVAAPAEYAFAGGFSRFDPQSLTEKELSEISHL